MGFLNTIGNAAKTAGKTTLGMVNPTMGILGLGASGALKAFNSFANKPTTPQQPSQSSSLAMLPSLTKGMTAGVTGSGFGGGGGGSWGGNPTNTPTAQNSSYTTPSYSNSSYNYTPSNSQQNFNNQESFPIGNVNDGQSNWSMPTNQNTPVNDQNTQQSNANPFNDQLKALQDKINSLNEGFGNYLKPGQDETDTQAKLDALNAQAKGINASKALGIANIEGQPIALNYQTGQKENVAKLAAAQMQALGAQSEPLTTQLARLQSARQNAAELSKYQLENVKGELSNLQSQYKPIEVGGNLVRINPATGQYETVFKGQQKTADEGFTLGEGQMRYDAKGNLIASGAPKSSQEQYTNDIKEYNFAKSQGYGGSFTDYQSSKGSGGSNNMNQLLSPSEAQALGVSYGTTRGQAAQMGITPRSSGGQQTPDQLKAADFANRMQSADQIINKFANVGAEQLGGLWGNLPNGLKSSERQQFEQAQKTFVNAILRRESGAAISPAEFKSAAEQYFPQPGDKPNNIAQKSALRAQVIQNMQNQAGSGRGAQQINPQEYQQLRGAGYSDQQIEQFTRQQGFNSPLNTGLKGSIEKKFPQGSDGGQCAHFVRQLVDIPPLGDGLNDKKAHVNKIGISATDWRKNPQVGDVVVTNENPTYGHVFVVNKVLPNGKIQITESNFKQSEKVSHDRIMAIDSKSIYGAIRRPLKV